MCRSRLGADCTKHAAVSRVVSASRRKRGRCRATAPSVGDTAPDSQRQVQAAPRSVPPEDAGKARASPHDGRSQESHSDECDGSRRGECGAATSSVSSRHGPVHQTFGNLPVFGYDCFDHISSYTATSADCHGPSGGELLPSDRRRSSAQQGGPEPVHRRLPEVGGDRRRQSSHPDRVGREGRVQGTPCPAVAAPQGADG